MPVDRVIVVAVCEVEERVVLDAYENSATKVVHRGRRTYLDIDVAMNEDLEVPVVLVTNERLVKTTDQNSYTRCQCVGKAENNLGNTFEACVVVVRGVASGFRDDPIVTLPWRPLCAACNDVAHAATVKAIEHITRSVA